MERNEIPRISEHFNFFGENMLLLHKASIFSFPHFLLNNECQPIYRSDFEKLELCTRRILSGDIKSRQQRGPAS